MPEVLNQSQIDALLNSINSGESVEAEVGDGKDNIKDYDFTQPKKFTKEQLRTVDSIYENLSRLVASYFSGILRVFCDVTVLQVEEQRYYEYNNALPDTTLIGLVDLKPKNINLPESTLMMDMSNNVAYFIMDRLLGGPGSGSVLSRDFTDIELAIMQDIYYKIAGFMLDTWKDHLEVSGELASLETNPRLIQIYAPEDIVVIVVLKVKLRELEGTMSVCIPAMGLENYLSEFASKYSRGPHKMSNERLDNMRRDLIKDSLDDSELELKAVFDQTEMDVADALRLRRGDVIPLPKPLNGIVTLEVDGTPWFISQLGNSRSKKAIKVLELVPQEEQEDMRVNRILEMSGVGVAAPAPAARPAEEAQPASVGAPATTDAG